MGIPHGLDVTLCYPAPVFKEMPERTRKRGPGDEKHAGVTRGVIRGTSEPPLPGGIAVDVALLWDSRLARYEARHSAVAAPAGEPESQAEPTRIFALPTEARMRLVSSRPMSPSPREEMAGEPELPRGRNVVRVDLAPARSRLDRRCEPHGES